MKEDPAVWLGLTSYMYIKAIILYNTIVGHSVRQKKFLAWSIPMHSQVVAFLVVLSTPAIFALGIVMIVGIMGSIAEFVLQKYTLNEVCTDPKGNVYDWEAEDRMQLARACHVFAGRLSRSRLLSACNRLRLVIRPEQHSRWGTLTH